MHYIVPGDKLYSDIPNELKFKGCVKRVKTRVYKTVIYDEPPFTGLSPTETNQVFEVLLKVLFFN